MKALRILLIVLVLLLVGFGLAYQGLQRWLDAPLAIEQSGLSLHVPRGQPLAATAEDLAARGVLTHPQLFGAYARLTGADARVRAGEYELSAGTTPRTLLEQLQAGIVVQHSVTIVEGWTFRELRRALEREPLLQHVLAGRSDAELMRELGEPDLHPEGLFFPDTYFFERGTTDLELLRRARARMRQELEAAWQDRAEDLPIDSDYQALVLASIIEKETALAAERPRIAGVFTERLRLGMPLQTDPTVIYGLGESFDGNLRRADLRRDGPYNTYTRTGLPPTPIAAPGAGSLRAAVRPEERGELYFVATGLPDGSHRFSKTLAEHNRAVAEYLARYRRSGAER
jgi:UPF0755 protein